MVWSPSFDRATMAHHMASQTEPLVVNGSSSDGNRLLNRFKRLFSRSNLSNNDGYRTDDDPPVAQTNHLRVWSKSNNHLDRAGNYNSISKWQAKQRVGSPPPRPRPPQPQPSQPVVERVAYQRANSETRRHQQAEQPATLKYSHKSRVFSCTDLSSGREKQHEAIDAAQSEVQSVQIKLFTSLLGTIRGNNKSSARPVEQLLSVSFGILSYQLRPAESARQREIDWQLVHWSARMIFSILRDCFSFSEDKFTRRRSEKFQSLLFETLRLDCLLSTIKGNAPSGDSAGSVVPVELVREVVFIWHQLIDHKMELLVDRAALTAHLTRLCFKYSPSEEMLRLRVGKRKPSTDNSTTARPILHHPKREALVFEKVGLLGLIVRLNKADPERCVLQGIEEGIKLNNRAVWDFVFNFYNLIIMPSREVKIPSLAGAPATDYSLRLPKVPADIGHKLCNDYLEVENDHFKSMVIRLIGCRAFHLFNRPPTPSDNQSPVTKSIGSALDALVHKMQLKTTSVSLKVDCVCSLLLFLNCQAGTVGRNLVDRLSGTKKRCIIQESLSLVCPGIPHSRYPLMLISDLISLYPDELVPTSYTATGFLLNTLLKTEESVHDAMLVELFSCVQVALKCNSSRFHLNPPNISNQAKAYEPYEAKLKSIASKFADGFCFHCNPEIKQILSILEQAKKCGSLVAQSTQRESH